MNKKLILFAFLLVSVFTDGQQKVIQLYKGDAPGSERWNWNEKENDSNLWQTKIVYNVSHPTLTVFTPDPSVANGSAAIICPGGAFFALSINSEGFDVARWLVKKGVTCFVLKYRLAHSLTDDPTKEVMQMMGTKAFDDATRPVIPLAISDGKAAISYIRQHASEYKISPTRIGIIGFSAGGTVAASAAFNYDSENRPDFVAPIYAFFPDSLQTNVPNDAPPMFIAAASDDQLGLAPHSLSLYEKWMAGKHSAELHLYAKGGHGFGMKTQHIPTDKWIDRLGDWLGLQGFLKKEK